MSDLLPEYLRIIRGHVINRYSWVARRGHCLFSVDDLIQIASIVLVTVARREEAEGRSIGPAEEDRKRFFGLAKAAVKNTVFSGLRDEHYDVETEASDSFDEPTAPGEPENRTTKEAQRSSFGPKAPPMLHSAVAQYFDTLPQRMKVLIALRYFDRLTMSQIETMTGVSSATARVREITDRWRAFARNQALPELEELPVLRPRPWQPPEALTEYLDARYQSDIAGYLGFFTIALRLDVGYLVDILGAEKFYVPQSHADRRALTHEQAAEADELLASGWAQWRVAEHLGVGRSTITRHARRAV